MDESVGQITGHFSHLLEKFGHESCHISDLVRSVSVFLDYFRFGIGLGDSFFLMLKLELQSGDLLFKVSYMSVSGGYLILQLFYLCGVLRF